MSKDEYASALYLVLSIYQNVYYTPKTERDIKAKAKLTKMLQRKGYIFKTKSPLKGCPTRKGLKAMFMCGYVMPEYKVQFSALQNQNIIPMFDENGNVHYI